MPIAGIGSWLNTIDEFATHWVALNNFLSANFALFGGYKQADLVADRAAVAAKIDAVAAAAATRAVAQGDRDVKRANLGPRFTQFNASVRGTLPGTSYTVNLPTTPSARDAIGVWENAGTEVKTRWTAINANSPAIVGFTPPLKLAGGYTLANFNTELAALLTTFSTWQADDELVELAIADRNATFAPVYQRMKQYREAALSVLPPGNALIASLPSLTPAPGSTPQAVVLSANWNAGISKASLSWSASAAADLNHYEVRYCTGTRYRSADELVVPGLGSIAPGTLTANTDFGLPASGASIIFKVYVITNTGNEKGSNSVKVIRP